MPCGHECCLPCLVKTCFYKEIGYNTQSEQYVRQFVKDVLHDPTYFVKHYKNFSAFVHIYKNDFYSEEYFTMYCPMRCHFEKQTYFKNSIYYIVNTYSLRQISKYMKHKSLLYLTTP